jgi:hypothetical protein
LVLDKKSDILPKILFLSYFYAPLKCDFWPKMVICDPQKINFFITNILFLVQFSNYSCSFQITKPLHGQVKAVTWTNQGGWSKQTNDVEETDTEWTATFNGTGDYAAVTVRPLPPR